MLRAGASRQESGTLWTTCQDNGVLMLKFTNGAWPLPAAIRRPASRTDRAGEHSEEGLRFLPSEALLSNVTPTEGFENRYHWSGSTEGTRASGHVGYESKFIGAGRAMLRGFGVLVAACGLLAASSSAQDIRIARAECSRPIHLVAKDAQLSNVLKRLSESLRFAVVYQSQTDPLVTIDARLFAIDLVRRLTRDMNFSLEQADDPRCAQGRRVAKLSVLPDPDGGNRGTVASARPAWQTPEMARIARLGMSDYLRSHGMPDQPMEELAVH